MSLKSVSILGLCLVPALSAAGAAESPRPAIAEAPIAVEVPEGRWEVRGGPSVRLPIPVSNQPSLAYMAEVFPRLTLDLMSFDCNFRSTRVEVTGLIPAQSFPQPAIELRIGDRSWSTVPNALYFPRSPAGPAGTLPQEMLDENLRGRDLSWPGHPPYALLRLYFQDEDGVRPALERGVIEVAFEGQRRRFPAVPAKVLEHFNQACADFLPRIQTIVPPRAPGGAVTR